MTVRELRSILDKHNWDSEVVVYHGYADWDLDEVWYDRKGEVLAIQLRERPQGSEK
jgi:hypothetical protein